MKALVCALLVIVLSAINAMAADPPPPIPYSIVISGGMSLGSYQAGYNWAIVKYMKAMRLRMSTDGESAPELVTASGTSAGGYNAIASALLWCADPDAGFPDSVRDNLLRNMWIDLGLDDLLPANRNSYGLDDGLLSRRVIRKRVRAAANYVDMPLFRPGCALHITIAVTRVKSVSHVIEGVNGQDIKVDNDRFVVPLTVKVGGDRRIRFENFTGMKDDPSLGNILYLPASPDGSIDVRSVIAVMEASSAFPVAFGKKLLTTCIRARTVKDMSEEADPACPSGYRIDTEYYVDGGIFDNVPLGAAKSVAESGHYSDNAYRYIYISPGTRRPAERGAEAEMSFVGAFDLKRQLEFLSGALSSGLQYELYNEVRSGHWQESDRRRLLISSRFPPLTGNYMSHFGAFLDRSFREYDYYAGIYDASMDIGGYLCGAQNGQQKGECLTERVADVHRVLGLVADPAGRWMFGRLAVQEARCNRGVTNVTAAFSGMMAATKVCPDLCKRETGIWSRIVPPTPPQPPMEEDCISPNLVAVAEAILREGCGEPEFPEFVGSLAEGFCVQAGASDALRMIIDRREKDELRMVLPLTVRSTLRLMELEREAYERWTKSGGAEAEKPYLYYRAGLGITGIGLEGVLENEAPFVPNRGTTLLPWMRLLPHEVGKDISRAGWLAAWEPRLALTDHSALNLKLVPYAYEGVSNGVVHYAQADAYFSWVNQWGVEMGAGPSLTRQYRTSMRDEAFYTGLAAYMSLADKVRFTVGFRSLSGKYPDGGWYYVLSITDLPGISYWTYQVLH